jgi:hypothetical protein
MGTTPTDRDTQTVTTVFDYPRHYFRFYNLIQFIKGKIKWH